ncbi:MAG: hypothetical protein ABIA97_02905 [Candidatus Omnitrophota bacterium]
MDLNKDLGQQPIAQIMAERDLKPYDLVAVSGEQITHKMVARAAKGKRLTAHVQSKILRAINKATGNNYSIGDLFNY